MNKCTGVLSFGFLFLLFASIITTAADRYKPLVHNDRESISFDTETIRYRHDPASKLDFIEVWIKHDFTPAGLKDYIAARKEANFTYPGYENMYYYIEHQLYSPNHTYCLLDTTDYTKDRKFLYRHNVTQILWRRIEPESVGMIIYNNILAYSLANYETMQKRGK